MKPAIKRFIITDDLCSLCGTCNKPLLRGTPAYYFHLEDAYDFCSEECFRAYYKNDTDVHDALTREDGYKAAVNDSVQVVMKFCPQCDNKGDTSSSTAHKIASAIKGLVE